MRTPSVLHHDRPQNFKGPIDDDPHGLGQQGNQQGYGFGDVQKPLFNGSLPGLRAVEQLFDLAVNDRGDFR